MSDNAYPNADGLPDPERGRRRQRPPSPARFADRLPPHSDQSEQGVLGCILWRPSECLDACAEAFGTAAGAVFYNLRHRMIYERARAMGDANLEIDLITLQEALAKHGELEQVGGIVYVSSLQDVVPSEANLPNYLDIVVEKWQWRELIRMCLDVANRPYDDTADPALIGLDTAVADIEQAISRIVAITSRNQERPIKQIIKDEVIPELEGHYTRGRAQIQGLTTGLEYVDKLLSGMGGKHGNYYVIAARPNVGKTSLVTQIAMHASQDYERWEPLAGAELPLDRDGKPVPSKVLENGETLALLKGVPVAISSLEMTSGALVQKMLFQRGRADLQRWRTGFAEEGDLRLLTTAAAGLARSNNIYIDDTPRLRIGQLKARWRRWHRQYGVRLFILDYLQLMQADKRSGRPDRVQELAEVSAEIQALGKELNCPMIILAQMNRDYEKDPNRAPRMSDLKDCGAVEQDADAIGFLYGPRLGEEAQEFFENAMLKKFGEGWKKWNGRPERINVLFAKNRFGPKGKAELLLLHSSTTFADWNVFLKDNNLKAAAKGEESRYRNEEEDDEG
jgi:replicative DNA helicase